MSIIAKLLSKKAGSVVSRKEWMDTQLNLRADLRKAKEMVKEGKSEGSSKKAVKNIQLDIKKLDKLKPVADKPKPKNKPLAKVLKDALGKNSKPKNILDPTPSSPRSAIVQAQQYKGKQAGLQKELDRTKALYEKLKDKKSEKAMLMRNKIKAMQKKLSGTKSIPMLPQDKNKGGMVKSKATTYKGGVLNGHGKDYGKPGGYNMGGLTKPTANQTGLKKLPSSVRNKMGYMYGGGMASKKKVTNMDYRKGGLVIMIGTGKPMKTKKGK